MNDATLIAGRLLDPEDHGSLEHITLHAQLGVLTLELADSLGVDPVGIELLASGDLVLHHPVGEGSGMYTEILGDLSDRLTGLPDDAHGAGTEVGVVLPAFLWHRISLSRCLHGKGGSPVPHFKAHPWRLNAEGDAAGTIHVETRDWSQFRSGGDVVEDPLEGANEEALQSTTLTHF